MISILMPTLSRVISKRELPSLRSVLMKSWSSWLVYSEEMLRIVESGDGFGSGRIVEEKNMILLPAIMRTAVVMTIVIMMILSRSLLNI